MPHPATIINPKWSERLKKLLAECKITQNELSKRIYLSQQTISKIKCGKAPLTLKTAQKITEAFPKYRAEWLLGIDDIPYRDNKELSELSWIPVTERLPESGTRALVMRFDYVTNTPFYDLVLFEKCQWWNRLDTGDYAVTHWMPLPEPPKEET